MAKNENIKRKDIQSMGRKKLSTKKKKQSGCFSSLKISVLFERYNIRLFLK